MVRGRGGQESKRSFNQRKQGNTPDPVLRGVCAFINRWRGNTVLMAACVPAGSRAAASVAERCRSNRYSVPFICHEEGARPQTRPAMVKQPADTTGTVPFRIAGSTAAVACGGLRRRKTGGASRRAAARQGRRPEEGGGRQSAAPRHSARERQRTSGAPARGPLCGYDSHALTTTLICRAPTK